MSTQEFEATLLKSSTEIESEIRDTRQRMDSTLDKLSNRLNPRSLVNSAMDWWDKNSEGVSGNTSVKKTYRALTSHVKKNPVPALLIGAGVAWLFLNSDEEEESTHGYAHRYSPNTSGVGGYQNLDSESEGGLLATVKEKAGEAKDAVSGILDTAKEKISGAKEAAQGLVETVKDKASSLVGGAGDVGEKAQEFYGSGKQVVKDKYRSGLVQLKEAAEEYPLAMGAAFLALGALTGVILPSTRKEDKLVGAKSDSLLETVKEKGTELLEQGKDKAGEIGENLLEEARSHGITAEAAGEKLTQLTGKAGEVLRKAAEEVGQAVKPDSENSDSSNEANPQGGTGSSSAV